MRKAAIHILLLAAVLLSSCSGKDGKVIPRHKLAHIYAEMFVADQRIQSDRKYRTMADTSLVYEPIFEKYGYTADDYRASMAYYIKDADRYARILRESSSILESELRQLKSEKKIMESIEEAMDAVEAFEPERIFFMTGVGSPRASEVDSLVFFIDSSGGQQYFDSREWLDTAFYGPEMVIPEPDTLSAKQDSVAADVIAGPAEMLKVHKLKTVEK